MRYVTLGEVPPKRHAQVWWPSNGGPTGLPHSEVDAGTAVDGGDRRLLVEEVLGYEGFSGNESILYHLHSPCRLDRVGTFTPIVRDEWVPTRTSTGSPARSRSTPAATRRPAPGGR